MCSNIKIIKCLVPNLANNIMSNFHPLEVVGRGSETQLQVGENLNYLIQLFNHVNGLTLILKIYK